MTDKYSIIPPTGALNTPSGWGVDITSPNLPQGKDGKVSVAGWTYGNEGFVQQTFLGASVRNFNIVGNFGDTSSTLSIDLINDEYNKSDKTGLGIGDDVYHDGIKDFFRPPPVGTPVFFKFGKNHATIEQAWRRLFDVTYNVETISKEELAEPPLVSNDNKDLAISNGYLYDLQKKLWRDLSDSRINDDVEYAGDSGDEFGKPSDKYYARGKDHIVFGGILQSYVQNRGPDGNPLYSVQVVDPREILSNVQIILNNYTGSVYENKNFINIYGFLEYDISDQLKNQIDEQRIVGYSSGVIESVDTWSNKLPIVNASGDFIDKLDNDIKKYVWRDTGEIEYYGNDMYRFEESTRSFPQFFPMTGEGFSRRSDQGIPWYRVRQALDAIFEVRGPIPQEFSDKGFGGPIDFRGFNYVVDFTGLPLDKIPQMYFLDFDQIDLLSLAQEICDVISHDLYVSLLPVINHPGCLNLYQRNLKFIENQQYEKIIAGIIRVEAINRSDSPEIGAIKKYIEKLKDEKNIYVENQDLGYELANITTDKIVVGAQKVDIHFFSDNKDRDFLELRKKNAAIENNFEEMQTTQWTLETALNQQIIPFYGFIGKNVPTIPKGWGPYQQILLDATGFDADGVGNYYIATEMELRAAMVSYEQWARFLLQYNETYIEEYGENSIFYKSLNNLASGDPPQGLPNSPSDTDLLSSNTPWLVGRTFGVTVPRCVFISEKNYMGDDDLPASPCSPPFGYPLYYKRAEKIGIPEAGVVKYQNAIVEVVTNLEKLKEEARKRDDVFITNQDTVDKYLEKEFLYASKMLLGTLSESEQLELFKDISECAKAAKDVKDKLKLEENIAQLRETIKNNGPFIKTVNKLAKKHLKNAKKVYQFVKDIAEQNLGKKFLVKIPKATNLFYKDDIEPKNLGEGLDSKILDIEYGPFGFKPQAIDKYYLSEAAREEFEEDILQPKRDEWINKNIGAFHFNTSVSSGQYYYGGLKVNFNPISDNWEFNYKPEPQGGFFTNNLFPKNLAYDTVDLAGTSLVTKGQKQFLIPMDLTNFESNGRISAYVRYDHSEDLDFSSVGRENFSQQKLDPNGYVPDISDELNNVDPDGSESFDQISERTSKDGQKKKEFVAFVKCEVDEQLYLLPKIVTSSTDVYGRETVYVPNARSLTTIETVDENGCPKLVPAKPYPMPIFTIAASGGRSYTPTTITDENGNESVVDIATSTEFKDFKRKYIKEFNAELIDTKKENLDTEHVYALITIPGRIIPTVDKRYVDGPYQAMNASDIKHILTQDVVRPPASFKFDKPTEIVGKPFELDCDKFTFTQLTNAQRAQKLTLQNIGFADPRVNIGFSQPSPIYPNLVAIPLLSRESCYGPWFSSSVLNGYSNNGERYKNIGGKVEFIKDENLAPWNYAGYQLMDDAGSIQAQFSNSLLLFSERGGISYPDAPFAVDIAKPLSYGGPLVTSVSVSINETSIKTSIKMDLYTSRFGKLNKQKEAVIAQVLREKQKLIDQKNFLTRRGFNKGYSNTDILSDIRKSGRDLINLGKASSDLYDATQLNKPLPDKIVVSLSSNSELVDVNGATVEKITYTQAGSIQDQTTTEDRQATLLNEGDENTLNRAYNQTAGVNISQFYTGYSTLPIGTENTSVFPSMPYSSKFIEQRT